MRIRSSHAFVVLLCGLLTGAVTPGTRPVPSAPAAAGGPPAAQVSASLARAGKSAATSRPPTLAESVGARLRRSPLRGARVGVEIVSLRDGRTLVEQNARTLLSPASTMKVLTAAAALDRLGPGWQYETRFLAAGPPVDGVVAGDLFVEGRCAPDLVVERFPELASGVLAAGVREIRGDLIADVSFFDGEERAPEWPNGGNPNPYAAPISALAANFSTVRITVTPAARPGADASVVLEPPNDAVPVSGRVKTTKGGQAVYAGRVLDRGREGGLANRIVVGGRIGAASGPWEKYIPIENPAAVAVSAVKRALENAGIVVRGTTRTGRAPAGATAVYVLRSKPLAEIVRDMNKHSQNFIAEMVQRTVGAEMFGTPATRAKGAQAVGAFLRTCGIDPAAVRLTDGSGLSRSNLLTADALVRVLVRMRQDPKVEAAFVDSLPIAAIDGTLHSRMNGLAAGRVRAKTGHIDGVTALAGYVDDASEGPLAFAFLVNDVSHPRALAALDDLCRILCTPR